MRARSILESVFESVYGQPSGAYRAPSANADEFVTSAAVRSPAGDIFLGDFHSEARDRAAVALNTVSAMTADFDAGFYTNRGRFLTRGQALELARQQKQLPPAGIELSRRANIVKDLDSADVIDFASGGGIPESVFGEPSGAYRAPSNAAKEYVVSAAVLSKDGDIFLGDHHEEARERAMAEQGIAWTDTAYFTTGFYTSQGRFLDRTQAIELAKRQHQVPSDTRYKKLTTPDIVERKSCCELTRNGTRCTRSVVVQRNGKPYCYAHDPERNHMSLPSASDRRRKIFWAT